MHPAARLFERALQEKLAEYRKQAFVPADPGQAAGPGGAPPGAPMDPMAGGAPPMDPMAGGAPPMDPMAGGAPPMDPMMGGAPMDPMMDPMMGGMPPEPEGGGNQGLTAEDAETVDKITQRTMNIVRETLEMVGKAKPVQPEAPEAAPAPESVPGPVTGQPGFDPATFGQLGAVKAAAAIGRGLIKHLSR
jgi:hypothetical protein